MLRPPPPLLPVVLLLLLAGWSAAQGSSPSRPNVVLLLVDDLGWGDVGYHGGQAETPAIDQLALEGLELDRFYTLPSGRATRAAWMSGLYPHHVPQPDDPPGSRRPAPLKQRTLPKIFQAVGYQTHLVGKWDRGHDSEAHLPTQRGFDSFYGCLGNAVDSLTRTNRRGQLDWHRDGKPVEETGYTTELLANEAVRLIRERDPSRPFLLELSFNAVRGPLRAPAEQVARHRGEPDPRRRVLLAMIESVDAAIGRVLATLDEQDIERNTLVLFASDNGGDPIMTADNHPLAGGKGSVREGGIRVPAVMRWEGVLPSSRTEQFLFAADLLPTLAVAAKIDFDWRLPRDGNNRWWQLMRQERIEPDRELIVHGDVALFFRNWKVVQRRGADRAMLYDVFDDPFESQDVSANFPDVFEVLSGDLTRRWKSFDRAHAAALARQVPKQSGRSIQASGQRLSQPVEASAKN